MNAPAPADALWRDHDGRPIFRHRPKLVGREIVFTLEDRDLAWTDGRLSGKVPLHQVEHVRLTFRPSNLYLKRYRFEMRQRLGRRIWFSNVSWRGMVEVEAHDAAYSAFVREVLTATAKASPKARFLAGEPLWRYIAMVAASSGLGLSLAYLAFHGLTTANWGLVGIVGFIGFYAAWQMSLWLAKNPPAEFDPLNPPAALLPDEA
jgi:hypothetical protein